MTIITRALRSREQQHASTEPLKSKTSARLEEQSPPRALLRTCSSPAPSTCSSASSTTRARSRPFRGRLSFSTPSFSSPMSLSRSSGGRDDSDDSEDERMSTQLGAGCQRRGAASALITDDSNKENVAPHRRLTQAALLQEELTQQQETTVQRTRTRAAAPMSDRASSFGGSTCSTAASRATAHLPKPRLFRRTVSSPMTTRKRTRGTMDVEEMEARSAAGDADVRAPSTPLSRMRLDAKSAPLARTTSNDDAESYFSSQAASLFERESVLNSQTSLSRCTTPELEDFNFMAVEEKSADGESSLLPRFANIYSHAKALLRYGSGTDSQIVGRERERCSLQRFLQKRFNLFTHLEHSASPQGEMVELDGAAESGSLYVCGLPGTGKTALVKSILGDLAKDDERTPRVAFVDCMSVQHPREVFAKILQALGEEVATPTGEQQDLEAERQLGLLVKDPRQRILIVLDEIDHLMRNRAHQNILYRVFSWGSLSAPAREAHTGSCALIGIANSLDLTERFVPLLASKGAAPAVLNFRPFEAAEMMSVLKARLSQLYARYDIALTVEDLCEQEQPVLPLLEPVALELTAKKIAAATGDLRKALDACRLAIDVVESEQVNASAEDLSKLTSLTAPKVKATHVLKVLSSVLGSPQLTKVRSLGLQSKLMLLATLIAQKRQAANLDVLGANGSSSSKNNTAGEMPIRSLESTYIAMLKNDDAGAFSTVESSELMDVVEGLEVEGILRITSDVGSSGSSSSVNRLSSSKASSAAVSPSGKRAAKKQLLAANRGIGLILSSEDVLRGICTVSPTGAVETSKVVVEAMNRIWNRESDRIERCKSWETMAAESRAVREEELGGGRGAIGI